MNHEETIAQLRAVRETTERTVQVINAAIERLESFQSVADAFAQWQQAQQAHWQAAMQAGGPLNLDIEEEARHAADVRRAEATLTHALQHYFAAPDQAEKPAETREAQGSGQQENQWGKDGDGR